MTKPHYINLYLTCKDQDEATRISDTLLGARLITCARFMPITSRYWWKDAIVDDREVLVIMESRKDLFASIESEVAKLHSYDTFNLQSASLDQVSHGAALWLDKDLKPKDNRKS